MATKKHPFKELVPDAEKPAVAPKPAAKKAASGAVPKSAPQAPPSKTPLGRTDAPRGLGQKPLPKPTLADDEVDTSAPTVGDGARQAAIARKGLKPMADGEGTRLHGARRDQPAPEPDESDDMGIVQGLTDDPNIPSRTPGEGSEMDEMLLRNDTPELQAVKSSEDVDFGSKVVRGGVSRGGKDRADGAAGAFQRASGPRTPLWWRLAYWTAGVLLSSGLTLYLVQSGHGQYVAPAVIVLAIGIYWLLRDT